MNNTLVQVLMVLICSPKKGIHVLRNANINTISLLITALTAFVAQLSQYEPNGLAGKSITFHSGTRVFM